MSHIHLLDDHLISQIAAGEVVERPASVVKELVENALDAGAREVRIELEGGGKRRIAVIDDGSGMGADDALLAFDRHATSKIATFDDLEKVATLGFRGEALASIAAVARVELRTAESAGEGTLVRIEGGRVKTAEPVAHPRGTRLEVASLFFNVPARRKFLKQPETELRRALEIVQGYALAHPEVRFGLDHEGRRLLETLPAGDGEKGLIERIGQVFGRELAGRLRAIEPPAPSVLEGEPRQERIRGFVGGPETARARRTFVYVNRRLVRDRVLLSRYYQAVREVWKNEDFPALFLFLELPPEEVDVNVHPQKTEVRFRDPGFVERVGAALRQALERTRGEIAAPLSPPRALPAVAPAWEGLGGRRSEPYDRQPWQPHPAGELRQDQAPYGTAPEPSAPASPAPERIAQPTFAPMTPRTVPLSGRSGEPRRFRLLGQYKASLIMLEGPDGLYLIDQHVAHERILYERLRRSLVSDQPARQTLLSPPLLELSPAEVLRLGEIAPALEDCGFEIAVLSGRTVALRAVPAGLKLDEAERLLEELATETGEAPEDAQSLRRRLLENLAASLSCRAAIKMHRPLGAQEMEALVSELFQAEDPYACPHGRPVVLHMGDGELERRFGRR